MRAIIEDNQWIWFDNITTAEEDILWEEFSVCNPNQYVANDQYGMWDGWYRKYNRAKKRIARPLLSMLREICTRHELPLVLKDRREPWPFEVAKQEDITPDFLPGITLDPHQIRAIQATCRAECGIIDIKTGGGKGECIAGTCKAIQCPTLILADQTIVIDQLKKRLELRDVAEEVGVFYAGKRPAGEMIVVGSIQSITPPTKKPPEPQRRDRESDTAYSRRYDKYLAQLQGLKTRRKNVAALRKHLRGSEMLIIDECDKASSASFKGVFRHLFKGRRRFGYSGTPLQRRSR